VNHRSAFRAFRSWARTAAACGFAVGVAAAVVACDKKPDPAAPAPANGGGGAKGSVGVLDANKMATALGWGTEQSKQIEAVVSDLNREVKSFVDALDKAIEDERKKIISSNRLTKTEDIDKLTKGQDLDKLPIKKEDLNEYVMVVQRARYAAEQAKQYATQALNQWKQQVDQVYTEAAKPAVRRAAQERGAQVVFLSNAVLHHDTAVDITDKVIDELQKSPARPTYPQTPKMNFPPVRLDEMTKPSTQPIMPPPPTTNPSK
jgi:Skp family chaperone for outer membrane proteins